VNLARANEVQFIGGEAGNPCEMRGKTPINIKQFCADSDTINYEGPDFHELQQSFTLVKVSSNKSKAIHPPKLG